MILSVSRRTDIPWFYSQWFYERVRDGYVLVRNPFNAHQVSRVVIRPDVVDCMVFWTKNPIPMMDGLEALEPYPYYFQFTLTGYGRDVEPRLPDKRKVLIPAFQKLAGKLGPERMVWRYDPILINGRYTVSYHLKAFGEIARALEGCTDQVVISFLDFYRGMEKSMRELKAAPPGKAEMEELAGEMSRMAAQAGMETAACAEGFDLSAYGVHKGACIDRERISRILGCEISGKKDGGQRPECGCMESIEIGSYQTCPGGCRYCYAGPFRKEGMRGWSDKSPILGREIGVEDVVRERKAVSLKQGQMRLDL